MKDSLVALRTVVENTKPVDDFTLPPYVLIDQSSLLVMWGEAQKSYHKKVEDRKRVAQSLRGNHTVKVEFNLD